MPNPILQSYGSIEWLASGELRNAAELSAARMTIVPGATSPSHLHSNCEEAAFVLAGEVEEVIGERRELLRCGGSAVAPRGVTHYFRNVGTVDAVVLIVFSSAYRTYEPAG